MISVPLLLKELRSTSRRWTTFLVRCLYVGIAALILWLFVSSNREALASPSQYAYVGRQLFWSINALQIATALLGAMLGCSDAVTGEVRSGTLGLILMTPLTPFRMVLAKWGASLFQTFTLLIAGAPALAVCAYLGGAGVEDLVQALGLCLLCAGCGGAMSLHASSVAKTPTRAFFTAFLRLFLLYLLWGLGSSILAAALRAMQSPGLVVAILQGSGFGLMALMIPLSLGLAARNTRKRLTAPERWNATAHSYDTKPSYYSKRLAIGGGVWESRPLLWKDLATRSSGRLSRIGRALIIALVAGFVLLTTVSVGGRTTGFIHFFGFILLILAVAQGASLFAPENSGRRWDMLLTAPVSPARIVGSKLLSGLLGVDAIAAMFILLFPLGAYFFEHPGFEAPAFLAVSAVLFLTFAYSLAAFCSLHSRETRNAFMGAGLVIGLLILIPLIFIDSGADGLNLLLRALNPSLLYEDSYQSHYYRSTVYNSTADFNHDRIPYFLFQWSLYGGGSAVLAMLTCRRLRSAAAAHA